MSEDDSAYAAVANSAAMTADRFDNDIVRHAVYKWLKGDGPEPYSVAVASLTALVLDLLERDRKRRDGGATIDLLRDALLSVEWSGPSCAHEPTAAPCPACIGGPAAGHVPTCRIHVALSACGLDTREKRDAERERMLHEPFGGRDVRPRRRQTAQRRR